mgnify:CR=1 FL=1
MKEVEKGNAGIKHLISMYRNVFRVRENLDFYSEKDFIAAERKFLKHALTHGGMALPEGVYRQGIS